jgi:putative transposase
MDTEKFAQGWRELSEQVISGMKEWREQHPQAGSVRNGDRFGIDVIHRVSLRIIKPFQQGILMNCPHCSSTRTTQLSRKTSLGYKVFHCRQCHRVFNERTGTQFNHLQFPTDIVLLVVLWRLRYKLSLRDLAEMFLVRGFEFTHEAVRDWEARFAPLITEQLRARRKGKAGKSWYIDETYLKVGGRWHYLYRAIDRDGNLVDSMLSEHRDMASAKRFFTQAREVIGHKPVRVTTDGHDSYPRAIRRILGRKVIHRMSRYLNNRLEQDHRGIKQRYYPLREVSELAPHNLASEA